MNIPQTLPITPLQSKAARYQLGFTQANVIDESGIPGHKLKGFESGRMIPDMKFMEALAEFYTGKGIELSTLKDGDGLTPVTAAAVAPKAGSELLQSMPGMYLRIAIPLDQIDAYLERMEAIDERIDTILAEPVKAGFLSGYDESTEALQRELFGHMAGNYLIFRALQGKSLTDKPAKIADRKTQRDLLVEWIGSSELAGILGGNENTAGSSQEDQEGV